MQQVAANKALHHNKHKHMMQQFAMLLATPTITLQFSGLITSQQARWPQAATQCSFIPQAVPILAPAQQWGPPPGGGSWKHSFSQWTWPPQPMQSGPARSPCPFCWKKPDDSLYPGRRAAQEAAESLLFQCGQAMDKPECLLLLRVCWHMSATFPCNKMGHMDGFTCTNYMEYKQANHQIFRKVMHKTMYPQM
jgi:hypothetical protein